MNEKEKKVLLIAHRGANKLAPENTLKAFSKAIELGADYIEFDIHQSKDGEIVVMGDANTLTTTGYDGLIKEMTIRELKKLDCGECEQIPTLKEMIEVTKGRIGLQCEVKAPGLANELVNILKEENLIETSIVSSFMYSELLKLKEIAPNLKLGFLFQTGSQKGVKRNIQKVKNHKLYAIHPQYGLVDKEIIEFAHENDIKVITWTVNTKRVIKKLAQMDVDGIITDDIPIAKEAIDF